MIITDEDQLRIKCEDVTPEEVPELVKKLEGELERSYELGKPGIGLAGPQIGEYKNIAIVSLTGKDGKQFKLTLANAKIKSGYNERVFEKEGCLSFPGKFVRSKRFQEIHVIDNLAKPNNFIATGLLAVVIQHELDHLNGKLLPDLDLDNK